MTACEYCDRDLRLDSRGRCKNCGGASRREADTYFQALSALSGSSPLADFQNFVAGTQQNMHGVDVYNPALGGSLYAQSLQRKSILPPLLGGLFGPL